MIIQIDQTGNNESKEDCLLELFNNGDSLDIGVKYEWDNFEQTYNKAEWVSLSGVELAEFFSAVKAIETTMKEAGKI